MKPILCLDFDGVLHSYESGWKGARTIPDPPVDGALEFLIGAIERFDVHILSSRSHAWLGRWAMKLWLRRHLTALAGGDYYDAPEWWRKEVAAFAFADPWPSTAWCVSGMVVRRIKWPLHKPPALVTIDDRAIQFNGVFPELDEIAKFKPWNRRSHRD